ncbi:WXG100 family type VII secretion target [Compostimonas suwonensis]|uniref:ESAT-6-like protein n=1 Tax=Compostimonas suwonensis TaxID=1048394 RepID=A0A2M9BVJ7_9MICO|nr:WXG100 family type VII secretion target [Compostimonas suwonensis]PJJ61972.1 WXG100 family type VII secretion target [Compostimonas suwonensis]
MRYQVDSQAVWDATASARSLIPRIQSEVSGLLSLLTSLEGSWSGEAATAFQGVVSEWRATQQQVEQSLTSIVEALDRAGTQYADAEAANTRLFGR